LDTKVLGIFKGKSAIKIFKNNPHLKQKPYWGNHSRGYVVTTVGIDNDTIKRYAKYQEGWDKKEEKQTRIFDLFLPPPET
jgi:putative transposase